MKKTLYSNISARLFQAIANCRQTHDMYPVVQIRWQRKFWDVEDSAFYLGAASDCTESNFSELLLHEGAVRDAPDGDALLREDNGPVLAVEHQADDVLLRHFRQLLVKDFLEHGVSDQRLPKGTRAEN